MRLLSTIALSLISLTLSSGSVSCAGIREFSTSACDGRDGYKDLPILSMVGSDSTGRIGCVSMGPGPSSYQYQLVCGNSTHPNLVEVSRYTNATCNDTTGRISNNEAPNWVVTEIQNNHTQTCTTPQNTTIGIMADCAQPSTAAPTTGPTPAIPPFITLFTTNDCSGVSTSRSGSSIPLVSEPFTGALKGCVEMGGDSYRLTCYSDPPSRAQVSKYAGVNDCGAGQGNSATPTWVAIRGNIVDQCVQPLSDDKISLKFECPQATTTTPPPTTPKPDSAASRSLFSVLSVSISTLAVLAAIL